MTIDTTAARLPVLNWTRPYRRIKEAESLADAIKTLRGDDPRPLLIQWEGEGELKDAPARQKTARATFSGHDTFLLAPFFQCYQIDREELGKDHPLRKLFKKGLDVHAVAFSNDGKVVEPITKLKNKNVLKAMSKVFKHDYGQGATPTVKKLKKYAKSMAKIDGEVTKLKGEIAVALEKKKDRVASKLEKEIEGLEADRKELEEQEQEVYDLELERKEPTPVVAKG